MRQGGLGSAKAALLGHRRCLWFSEQEAAFAAKRDSEPLCGSRPSAKPLDGRAGGPQPRPAELRVDKQVHDCLKLKQCLARNNKPPRKGALRDRARSTGTLGRAKPPHVGAGEVSLQSSAIFHRSFHDLRGVWRQKIIRKMRCGETWAWFIRREQEKLPRG